MNNERVLCDSVLNAPFVQRHAGRRVTLQRQQLLL